MVIGIDSSRAYISDKTGTENYSFHLINEILRLPESKLHTFVLFIRPNAILPVEFDLYTNLIVKVVRLKYLWTQLGLAWETWFGSELDVLWVPAHTLPVLRNPHIKTVVTIHGLEYQWLPEYKNLLQRWYLPLSTFYAAKSASKLIAVSKFTENQLVKELHTDKKKIKVIYEGVEINVKSETHDRQKIFKRYDLVDKKYILFVGTIQPRKNLVALVEAFSHFASGYAKEGESIKLVIAGGVGWMAQDVLAAPEKYDVGEKVVFTGRITETDLACLYQGALIYVQPSITEGFGLPVLEAMSASVAVISSDGGALPEIVGDVGICVKLNSDFVDQLADHLQKLVCDAKLRSTMVTKGKKWVKQLSWQKAAKETFNVLINA
jgi:glycosyltransferase involved in cell wall biosynthesis